MALSSYHSERYGVWAGNERGIKADPSKCAANVTPKGRYISFQCSRARGFGPEQAFCKQHAKHADWAAGLTNPTPAPNPPE